MSLPSVLQMLLPTLLPLVAGYAVARWAGLNPKPLSVLLRLVLFPALLFTSLHDRMPFHIFLLVAATGSVMTFVALALRRNAHRFLKPPVDASAGVLNIACFMLPFLALSWATNGLATACALFTGAALTWFALESWNDPKALLREPWVYAVAAAFFFPAGRIDATWLDKLLAPLAAASYPVLLVFLGAALQPGLSLRDGGAWATVSVRLLSGLGVGLVAVAVLPFSAAVAQGLILTSLAPPATKSLTLETGGADTARAQAAAALGTLVSLAVIVTLLVTGWKPWA